MKETNGAMNHYDLMKLPWRIFCSYIESINSRYEEKQDIDYFNGSSKLANAWQENKDKWQLKVVN